MVGVDGRGRVDLQAVVTLAGVLEQTVHGVQDFVGQQEEPFSAKRNRTLQIGLLAFTKCLAAMLNYVLPIITELSLRSRDPPLL